MASESSCALSLFIRMRCYSNCVVLQVNSYNGTEQAFYRRLMTIIRLYYLQTKLLFKRLQFQRAR